MRAPGAAHIRVGIVVLALAGSAGLASTDPFPELLPSTRAQAVETLVGGSNDVVCLSPLLAELRHAAVLRATEQRAQQILDRRILLTGGQTLETPEGITVQFTTDPLSIDQVAPSDEDADGVPDVVEAALAGVNRGRELFGELDLAPPEGLDLLLANLGSGTEGFAGPVSRRPGRLRLVVEASAPADPERVRRAALHQYAHALALASGARFAPSWSEAFATWAVIAAEGGPDAQTRRQLSERLARLESGLGAADGDLGAGDALWLAFLDEAYGPAAVRATFDELARGGAPEPALERAIARSTSVDLAAAFREFHLWTLLVGARADGRHLSFASALEAPPFAVSVDGLPALAIHVDPAIAGLGASQVRLIPNVDRGGIRVHFDGDDGVRWEVDLLLVRAGDALQRVPLGVRAGRAETTVPADGIAEAWLLVRRPGYEAGAPRRFSFAVEPARDFPFRMTRLEAVVEPAAARITWDTESEQGLLGFNIVRVRDDGGIPVTVNPVWIPAFGDGGFPASYQFVDRTVEPGVGYRFIIEGLTRDGLAASSEPVGFKLPKSQGAQRAR